MIHKEHFHGLKHVLLVLVYLTLINLPASYTAPIKSKMFGKWWNNPCDIDTSLLPTDIAVDDFQTWNMDDLINQVYITSSEANRTKEDYAQKTFSKSFDELFVDRSFGWLPALPKQYKEEVPENELKSKTPIELVKELYRYLQVYGVGIDVAANEATPNSADQVFSQKRAELRALLCEFNSFLTAVKILPSCDVTESIMPDHMKRNLDTTGRDTRNYIVYKEYLNCLEYLDQVLKYLKLLQSNK
ncbi:uncharacterized protein LOC130893068 isoform X2 [Diorhabda carinulata]|uniref:uncharacterized protein LOC130893068 isoform X2 n=1 Tax=Diorhabda carinulata TaxID=1163345 RepID=UPI0025A1544D|nr:uncharacterized protein LOC130893068 isoform X2 [Diorhabda carinulata]